ncbi:MAG: YbaB/EbfC family nucleoid-associated protein [Bacilli bacterium]|nr:YbaB/EbfC family nucleoid-associated protein [Bacilli bacterium]
MNIQAIMKQAQSLQKDMQKQEEEIEKTTFDGESALVKVKVNGKKEILSVEIQNKDNLEKDDLEILEDMIMVAINNAFKKVDDLREKKMSKYSNMMPGLF